MTKRKAASLASNKCNNKRSNKSKVTLSKLLEIDDVDKLILKAIINYVKKKITCCIH